MAQRTCPNCNDPVEEGSTECLKCGIIFKRFEEAQRKEKQQHEEQAERERREKIAREKRELKEKTEREDRERKEKAARLKQCRACDSKISSKARYCPKCGDPQEKPDKFDDFAEVPALLGIFDFQFKSFITPLLVKIGYALSVLLLIVAFIGIVIPGFLSGEIFKTIKYFAGFFFGSVGFIIFIRILSESALLLFKIEENTRK